jgi:hypothetical protein
MARAARVGVRTVTGIAPEPADRAIARLYAASVHDYAGQIADSLAALLNEATGLGVSIVPHPDPDGFLDPTYSVEARTVHTVQWERPAKAWLATDDTDRTT